MRLNEGADINTTKHSRRGFLEGSATAIKFLPWHLVRWKIPNKRAVIKNRSSGTSFVLSEDCSGAVLCCISYSTLCFCTDISGRWPRKSAALKTANSPCLYRLLIWACSQLGRTLIWSDPSHLLLIQVSITAAAPSAVIRLCSHHHASSGYHEIHLTRYLELGEL